MIRFLLLVFTVIITNQGTLGTVAGRSENVGISGGKPIPIEAAPFTVSLWRKTENNKHYHAFCGGSIIHERFILTAAHCFRTVVPVSYIKVYIGSDTLYGEGRVLRKVKNTFSHEEFSFDRFGNDICLLELRKPIKFGPKVAKVDLPAAHLNLEPGTEVNVTGWGVTETVGDSGGPLTYNNIQIGLVSYGEKCKLPSNGVGVYTRISSYLKWINETINNNLP